ncbi:hypothetical protein PPH41_39775 [Burkholderia gladioli]|nr:hypothetical protein [Burkholderia gladioli]
MSVLKITKFQSVISEKSNFSWPVPIAVHQYGAVLKMALEIWRHGRSVERAEIRDVIAFLKTLDDGYSEKAGEVGEGDRLSCGRCY